MEGVGVVVSGGCGGVSAEVADGYVEVAIGVEMGEGEGVVFGEGGVVFGEGGVRRKDESLFFVFHHFCLYFCLMLLQFFFIALCDMQLLSFESLFLPPNKQ